VEQKEMDRRENKWQVDKHIPIAIIIGMLAQTAFAVWYVATFTAVTNSRLNSLEEFKLNQSDAYAHVPEKIARLEAQQSFTNLMLSEVLGELKNDNKR
jgi:hypothetical protein